MAATVRIELGTRLRVNGEDYIVTGLKAGSVIARSDRDGLASCFSASALVPPLAEIIGAVARTDLRDSLAPLDDLPEHVAAEALRRQKHVREALTGFKSGIAVDALPGEPQPRFDPACVPQRKYRFAAKARDLGMSSRQFQRWVAAYENGGIRLLADGRSDPNRPGADVAPEIEAAARAEACERIDKSTVTRTTFWFKVRARVKREHGPDAITFPSAKTFYRWLDVNRGELGITFAEATARRRRAAKPPVKQ